MTVVQLIELLKRAPQNAKVEAEGCDCTGDAAGLQIFADGKTVMILRFDGVNTRWQFDGIHDDEASGVPPIFVDERGDEGMSGKRTGEPEPIAYGKLYAFYDSPFPVPADEGEWPREFNVPFEPDELEIDVEFPGGVVAVDKDGKVIG